MSNTLQNWTVEDLDATTRHLHFFFKFLGDALIFEEMSHCFTVQIKKHIHLHPYGLWKCLIVARHRKKKDICIYIIILYQFEISRRYLILHQTTKNFFSKETISKVILTKN